MTRPPVARGFGSGVRIALDLLAHRLEARRQRQLLAQVLHVLVGVEAGAHGGELEQHAAGLAEVDRAEPEAVDDRRRAGVAGLRDALAATPPARPSASRTRCGGPCRRPARADARRRRVVGVEAAALVAAHLPLAVLAAGEAERLAQQRLAAGGVARVGADAVEALQRVLARDLGVVGDQRGVADVGDLELVLEALGVGEAQARRRRARASTPCSASRRGPEVERLGRGDAPDDAVDLAVAGAAAGGAGVLEERQVGAGRALLVGVEEVVDGRIVLVDGLLDHPQAERAARRTRRCAARPR